jgi:hypothetical protein
MTVPIFNNIYFFFKIEHGRWNNIPRENRKCNLCNLEEIGDEFHYILNCPYFKQYRDIYIKKRYTKRPTIFHVLLAVYGLLFEIYIELRNLFRLKYLNIVQK